MGETTILCETQKLKASTTMVENMDPKDSFRHRLSVAPFETMNVRIGTENKKRKPNKKAERVGAVVGLICFLFTLGFLGYSAKYLAMAIFSFIVGLTIYFSRRNMGSFIFAFALGIILTIIYIVE